MVSSSILQLSCLQLENVGTLLQSTTGDSGGGLACRLTGWQDSKSRKSEAGPVLLLFCILPLVMATLYSLSWKYESISARLVQ